MIEEKGPDRMPGFCCMDVATNSQFFGYDVSRKFWLKQVNCQNHSSDHECPVHTLFNPPTAPQFDPSKKDDVTNAPMKCQNNGPWHLGISAEACENAGGEWFRTPCVTLKETIDNRPSRFDLDAPMDGDCQYNLDCLETVYVSVSTFHDNFTFTSDKGNDVDRLQAAYIQTIFDQKYDDEEKKINELFYHMLWD